MLTNTETGEKFRLILWGRCNENSGELNQGFDFTTEVVCVRTAES